MKQLVLAAAGLMLILNTAPSARAQVTVDVAKITCEQFRKYEITTSDNIAIWLSGYYHGNATIRLSILKRSLPTRKNW
jgi:HdeA/HdeB family